MGGLGGGDGRVEEDRSGLAGVGAVGVKEESAAVAVGEDGGRYLGDGRAGANVDAEFVGEGW